MLAAAGALAVPIGALAAIPAASSHTKTYTTPGTSSFKVPKNVAKITVTAIGAAGGSCSLAAPGTGGEGATVTGTVKVKPGSTLFVGVGGVGGTCGEPSGGGGGIGGGGASGTGTAGNGGGGGGESGVGMTSLGAGGGALVVAGGGGGAGFCGANGGNADTAGGTSAFCNSSFAQGGGPGTSSAGGAGGASDGVGSSTAGAAGTAGAGGAGGNGGNVNEPTFGGGGGGGGYYGGGGGGGAAVIVGIALIGDGNSGGGGGGASFTASHATGVTGPAASTAAAMVKITYTAQPKPKAVTHKATGVKSTSATIHGSVNPEGLKTTYYFQYGTTTKYGKKTGKHSLKAAGKFSSVKALLTGLKPSTKYHFRVVASNASGKADGKDMTFTTPSVAPAFTG